MITDQDFYALRRLKIPTHKHGILEEIAQKDKEEEGVSAIKDVTSQNDAANESDSSCSTVIHTVSISKQSKDAKKFLKQMDKDIKSIVDSTVTRHQTLEETANRLTCRRFYPLEPAKANYGATWGITASGLILFFVLIVLVTPFAYYFFCKGGKCITGDNGGTSGG